MTHAASSDEVSDIYFTELLPFISTPVLLPAYFVFPLFCLYFRFSYFLSLFFVAPFFRYFMFLFNLFLLLVSS